MNMVMTFFLHPLSYYNSITESRARFLLSILDVYWDMATHDKLILPSTITRILCHFSVPFPSSDHFSVLCAIDYATVKRSEAQFWSRQSDTTALPSVLLCLILLHPLMLPPLLQAI